MKVLGIESSCDETAAAIVEDGRRLLSNVVHSQIDIHAAYGGVVPEVAARSHIEMINPVIKKALIDAGLTWDDIDAVAVTYAPGLIGSLLVGTLAARTLALLHDKPLYAIHHVEAHVYANFIVEEGHTPPLDPEINSESSLHPLKLAQSARMDIEPVAAKSSETSTQASMSRSGDLSVEGLSPTWESRAPQAGLRPPVERPEDETVAGTATAPDINIPKPLLLPSNQPTFPMLALIVSGGHSQLVLFHGHGDYELLGQTQDDAVGEAFDKVAKIIGLPYPGGPSIAGAAEQGDPHRFAFPKAKLQGKYDFSFSGLKTAVLRTVQREVGVDTTFPSHELPERVNSQLQHDIAASFQQIAIETLVDKAEAAYRDYQPASVVIAGGVAASAELRRQLSARLPLAIEYAPMQLCTDNAAMIATLGYYYAQVAQPADPRNLEVVPSLSMTKTAWANRS